MAGEPSSDTRQQSTTMPDSDMDAEHDGDVSMSEATNGFDRTSYDADPDGSDVDAEGEEVDDEDLGGIPHQVKAPRAYISVPPDDLSQDSDAEMLESDVISDASSEASSSDTQEWGADDTAGEDTDGEDAEAEEIEDSEVEDADGEDAEAALTREGATPGAVTDNNFCM
ncbi:hypothetical protein EJ06DRAFT_404103 [Trichodelitschia bisporula]|uniref:Uncharacterized protein n=1 Tax=Trichodelitschia bisporula TaxID=703511 RepID=A0A6G1HXF7_9PEZI|nr:hypothetical protein EJ06DRAFT_404103 [Trichodelitschia bisporula]